MSYRADAPPIAITLLLVAMVGVPTFLCLSWIIAKHEADCQAACTTQYGSGYQARVTENEISHVCDCIGPEGGIKAPR